MKNPYYLGDEVGLTQTLGWVDAWTFQPTSRASRPPSTSRKSCPCCRGELHRIGEDVSEKLDVIPAQFRVSAAGDCRCGRCFYGRLDWNLNARRE